MLVLTDPSEKTAATFSVLNDELKMHNVAIKSCILHLNNQFYVKMSFYVIIQHVGGSFGSSASFVFTWLCAWR